MKAVRIHQYGSPDVLQIDEIPEPSPLPHEVKIEIKASGLNHLDLWVRGGLPGIKLPLPLVPGSDAAGIVVGRGKKVKKFKIGDRVFLDPGFGCGRCEWCRKKKENLCLDYHIYGEHCNGTHRQFVSFPENHILPLPKGISFEEGAAFPLVFQTAWHMLVVKGQIKKGETVLVMAGGSGVGSAGIQIAKRHGCKVITTAGTEEARKRVKVLGADFVIDHYHEEIAAKVKEFTQGRGVQVVLEHVGAKVWQECLKSLAKGGRLITCGGTTGGDVSIQLRHLFIKHHQIIGSTMGTKNDLIKIAAWVAKGRLKPVIHKVLPYTAIKEAHEILEKGGLMGKVVLKW